MQNNVSSHKRESYSDSLIPLTPEYKESRHGQYIDYLNKCLENPELRNIGLLGNYGVGKSSVLKELADLHDGKVLRLSFSTLVPTADQADENSFPEHAQTPNNRIQRELVKQLLYREDPGKLRGSRFRRIERFDTLRAIYVSLIATTCVTPFAITSSWATPIETWISKLPLSKGWLTTIIFVSVWLLLGLIAFTTQQLSHGRIRIHQLSTGPATVALDEHSVSYFDQYLDEIFHAFESSEANIVVFEDIDRLEDSQIFESLRSLNVLLNSPASRSKQPIRFIYAIRDSVFDQLELMNHRSNYLDELGDLNDNTSLEIASANRTKFFDIVIPIVPFISSANARGVLFEVLESMNHNISTELVDLVAHYIPDMRLIKNARNEFVVFRQQVLNEPGLALGLNETSLFAMMVYKGTHQSDFEKIASSKSKLNDLYVASREFIAINLSRIRIESTVLKNQIETIEVAEDRSEQLGNNLVKYLNGLMRILSPNQPMEHSQYQFAGRTVQRSELFTKDFWMEFIEPGSDRPLTVSLSYPYSNQLRFHRADLADALDDPLNFEQWNEAALSDLEKKQTALDSDRIDLETADIRELIKLTRFTISKNGETQRFSKIAKGIIGEGLTLALIENGYIDDNFALYASSYSGARISPRAMNYILHHVDRSRPEPNFILTEDEVRDVLRERQNVIITNPNLYNTSITDYIVSSAPESLSLLVEALAEHNESSKTFVQSYLEQGSYASQLLAKYAKVADRVLDEIVSHKALSTATQVKLVDSALKHLSAHKEYLLGPKARGFLKQHNSELKSLTESVANPGVIANLFAKAGVKVTKLSAISENLKPLLVEKGLFTISINNLKVALGSEERFSLDEIYTDDKELVYTYLISDLESYLQIVGESVPTVKSSKLFPKVINDAFGANPDWTDGVISQAAPSCQIEDLSLVPEETWEILAKTGHFRPTLQNISLYLGDSETLDDALGLLLSNSRQVEISASDDGTTVRRIAYAIINSSDQLPDANLRVKLAASMEPELPLDSGQIDLEEGPLFGILLADNLIEDNLTIYQRLNSLSWRTRECWINHSSSFIEYMTPDLILQEDYPKLIDSVVVSENIKQKILDNLPIYLPQLDLHGIQTVASAILQREQMIDLESIAYLANEGLSAEIVVPLISLTHPNTHDDQIPAILLALGGTYEVFAKTGTKRPLVANDEAHRSLLSRMQKLGIVSDFKVEKDQLRITLKQS